MKIFKQILKEFWLPLVGALIWSGYNFADINFENFSINLQDIPIKDFVNIFVPSFFLISWLTGQYFRVRKQTEVKDGILGIQEKTQEMLEQIEIKTNDLIDHMTGGDSFCHLAFANLLKGVNSGVAHVVHEGKHPLYDVSARIVDLQIFEKLDKKNMTYQSVQKAEKYRHYGDIVRGLARGSEIWDLGSGDRRDFNIFWTAKNGAFTQLIRFRKVNDRWSCATKVNRGGTVYERIEGDFPLNKDGTVDWGA